jgi:hypothetical protein
MKNFFAGAIAAFSLVWVVAVFAQNRLNVEQDFSVPVPEKGFSIPIDYQAVIMAAKSPSGKAKVIQSDEEGRVICAPQ